MMMLITFCLSGTFKKKIQTKNSKQQQNKLAWPEKNASEKKKPSSAEEVLQSV